MGVPVPLSHVIVPVRVLNIRIAGTKRDGEPASLATEEEAQAWLDGMPHGPMGCLADNASRTMRLSRLLAAPQMSTPDGRTRPRWRASHPSPINGHDNRGP